MILINGRMSERSFQRWRNCGDDDGERCSASSTCAWRSRRAMPTGSRHSAARTSFNTGNLKLDVPAPPADPQKLEQLKRAVQGRAGGRWPPRPIRARKRSSSTRIAACAAYFPSLLTIIVPRHPDRGPQIAQLADASSAAWRRCVRRASCRHRRPRFTSPTRSANSACSIGSRRSCSSAARWWIMAARIRSSRSSSALPSCTVRMSGTSPRSTARSTTPVARACRRRRGAGRS